MVMLPWFSTLAPDLADWSKVMRPAMKSWLLMFAAETIRPAVFTWAPL